MRAEGLLQRHRPSGRRRRPGYFRVERPDQPWHMDMTSIWVGEHGWCYLNAIVVCCAREILAWGLDLRCRRQEAEAVVGAAVESHRIEPGGLTLGTDNGTAYTSRGFCAHLADLGVAHRRGGYRDPESQAFIESWFSKLKERLVWRSEFETLGEAGGDRRLRRDLPPPAPLGTGLPHPEGGEADLRGCPGVRSVYEITRPRVTTLEGSRPGATPRAGPGGSRSGRGSAIATHSARDPVDIGLHHHRDDRMLAGAPAAPRNSGSSPRLSACAALRARSRRP